MSQIEVKNVACYYHNSKKDIVKALDDLSVNFESGKINVILGPSGSGKTTLIRCILGFEDYSGTIIIDNEPIENIPTKNRKMSYVAQDIVLYPFMDVFHNIANPLTFTNATTEEIRKRVFEVAKFLDIEFLLFRKPKELSVGQAQKVVIAKAMVKEPRLYLFDEQFANIDPSFVGELRIQMKQIFKSLGSTVIMITHNIDDAVTLADKIFILKEGKIVDSGTPIEMMKQGRLLND